MVGRNVGVVVLLLVCAVYSQAKVFVIDQRSSENSLQKSSSTVCKVKVFCQMTMNNAASSVNLGDNSICNKSDSLQRIVTVGSGDTIPLNVNLQTGDYFRAIITEIPNSCTDTTTTTKDKTGKCVVTPSGLTGSIQSPDFPLSYEANVKCEYTFETKPDYCAISLDFSKFEMQKTPGCKADYLKLGNRSYCGETLLKKKMNFKLPLKMTFNSNGDSITGKGFLGTFEYVKTCDSVCSKTEDKVIGRITPPLTTTGGYKPNMICKNEIVQKSKDYKCVEVTIINFEDLTAAKDYIQIDGQKFFKKPTENKVLVNFPEDGNSIFVDFVTDEAVSVDEPFYMKYKQLRDGCPAKRCQPVVTELFANLKNPEDLTSTKNPKPYPKNYECEYVIKKVGDMTDATILLRNKLGDGDSLKVTTGTPAEELEYNKGQKVTFKDDKIVIKFMSDGLSETTFSLVALQSKS